MRGRLDGKRIIVIGSARGIGAATVRRLASEGAIICAADIDLESAEAVAAQAGNGAFALPIDIADEVSVAAAIAAAASRLGRLDGAHLNAADLRVIFQDSDALTVDLAVFDRTIEVNLRGQLLCTRAVLPHLLATGSGAIVYTSSDACGSGEPERPSYGVSKSGLNALMRHVASRWGKLGITANCIAPGFVMTAEMKASGKVPDSWIAQMLAVARSPRLGESEDVAAMAALLLSDDGRWVNGQVIHVNGGALLH